MRPCVIRSFDHIRKRAFGEARRLLIDVDTRMEQHDPGAKHRIKEFRGALRAARAHDEASFVRQCAELQTRYTLVRKSDAREV